MRKIFWGVSEWLTVFERWRIMWKLATRFALRISGVVAEEAADDGAAASC